MDGIRRYVALIDRNSDGEYFVRAPDLPGFNAGGTATLQEAMAVAADVLRDWSELTVEAGGTIRDPRTLDELKADPDLAEDFAGAEMVTTIPLLPLAEQKARVNVSLDRAVLAAIDVEARRLKMDRSEYLTAAARHLMAQG